MKKMIAATMAAAMLAVSLVGCGTSGSRMVHLGILVVCRPTIAKMMDIRSWRIIRWM